MTEQWSDCVSIVPARVEPQGPLHWGPTRPHSQDLLELASAIESHGLPERWQAESQGLYADSLVVTVHQAQQTVIRAHPERGEAVRRHPDTGKVLGVGGERSHKRHRDPVRIAAHDHFLEQPIERT